MADDGARGISGEANPARPPAPSGVSQASGSLQKSQASLGASPAKASPGEACSPSLKKDPAKSLGRPEEPGAATVPAGMDKKQGPAAPPAAAHDAKRGREAPPDRQADKPRPFPEIADPFLFPPTLYPGFQRHAPADFMLAGLAATYPGRVAWQAPDEPPRAATLPPRPPMLENLPENVEYVRCHPGSLAGNAAAALKPPSAGIDRIVDLRYFATPASDADACATLCEQLTGARPRYNAQGNYPFSVPGDTVIPPPPPMPRPTPSGIREARVLVLAGGGTSGPMEAMLADLLLRRKIILVGTPTAGRTARLGELKTNPGWWVIAGEIQPGEKSISLVGTGLEPAVNVATTREGDFLAWQRVERGERPSALLRAMRNGSLGEGRAADESAAPEGGPPDLVLRRAYDLALALRLQGQAPSAASDAPAHENQ